MLTIKHLTKQFGEKTLFRNLCLTVEGPAVLWAPSGWGKTTLLRILMGLEEPKKADAFASAFLFVRTLSVSLCSKALPKGELYKRGSFKILFPRGSACQKMSKSSPIGGAGKADRL